MYIVPPYLLQTCLGLTLQRQVAALDPQLAAGNTLDLHRFRQPSFGKTQSTLPKPLLDAMRDRLAVLGVLGNSANSVSEEYIAEMYETFRERMRKGEKPLIFDDPKVGRVLLGKEALSLEELVETRTAAFSPDLDVNGGTYTLPLPMYWTPLFGGKQLEHMTRALHMATLVAGHTTVSFALERGAAPYEGKKQYFNFIANQPVDRRTGVFYYEVQVEQLATAAAGHTTLFDVCDGSLSSGCLLYFSLGYAKNKVRFDKTPADGGCVTQEVELRGVQRELLLFDARVDEDTLAFLATEPGVALEGSFGVNFNRTCSYAAVKTPDSGAYRSSALNVMRRVSQFSRHALELDTSKLDLEVPFSAYPVQHANAKSFTTAVVGCGVNMIEQSLFITLNGVPVKTISGKDLMALNRFKDGLFEDGDGLLFPMIGFQLSELPTTLGPGELPLAKIVTNFGLEPFRFNIELYVRDLKSRQLATLDAHEPVFEPEDEPSDHFERAVRGIKDDPLLLDNYIRGYLVQEGFLDTLAGFEKDLAALGRDTWTVEASAESRRTIKHLVLLGRFLEAAQPIAQYGLDYTTDLELFHYMDLLRRPQSDQAFQEAYDYGSGLLKRTKGSAAHEMVKKLSLTLLVKDLCPAEQILHERDAMVEKFASDVNAAILRSLGFKTKSNLEVMVGAVGENITKLCDGGDDAFRLVNYEMDYVDV